MDEVLLTLSLIGIIILLGFAGNVLFKKTNIPNTLWLLFFGVMLSFLNFGGKEALIGSAGLIGAIAIIGILSEGGMNLNLGTILKDGSVGWLLMVVGMLFSIMSSIFVLILFGFPIETGILVGLIIAGTSASVVIPIMVSLNVSEKVKTILSIESIADTFSIVIALLAMGVMAGELSLSSGNIIQTAMSSFFSAIAAGVFFGLFWATVILKLKKFEFFYAATLGALILLYAFAEFIGASGAIAIFSAGIMIANSHFILGSFYPEKYFQELDSGISKTHSLIVFFIKVFFFVFLGVIVGLPTPNALVMGFLIMFVILLFRIGYIKVFVKAGIMNLTLKERRLAFFSVPRGLSAAVLAGFVYSFGIPQAFEIVQIIFSVILFSIIFTTAGTFLISRPETTEQKPKTAPAKKYPAESFG